MNGIIQEVRQRRIERRQQDRDRLIELLSAEAAGKMDEVDIDELDQLLTTSSVKLEDAKQIVDLAKEAVRARQQAEKAEEDLPELVEKVQKAKAAHYEKLEAYRGEHGDPFKRVGMDLTPAAQRFIASEQSLRAMEKQMVHMADAGQRQSRAEEKLQEALRKI